MKRLTLLAVVALLLATPAAASAQCATPNGQPAGTCSSNIASSLTIPTVLLLSIDDTTTALAVPTETDYTSGSVTSTGPTITIKSNSNWTLLVRAGATTWTGTGTGVRANKPVSDLGWNTNGGASFTTMTTTDASVGSGTRGASNVRTFTYKVNWNWLLDTPGTYSLQVWFTVTSP